MSDGILVAVEKAIVVSEGIGEEIDVAEMGVKGVTLFPIELHAAMKKTRRTYIPFFICTSLGLANRGSIQKSENYL